MSQASLGQGKRGFTARSTGQGITVRLRSRHLQRAQRLRKQARDAGKKNGRAIWQQYFLIRDAFASLGPAAVLTVHRSQGSSFGDVFVAPDVFRADPAIRQQLCYVAVSRARIGVWLLGGETSTDLRSAWQREFDTTRDHK